ncbi:MAG: hypothetical protein PHX51_01670 [Clostridia bacterium]|nr:hypothetical protein [Clostridia bacterium]
MVYLEYLSYYCGVVDEVFKDKVIKYNIQKEGEMEQMSAELAQLPEQLFDARSIRIYFEIPEDKQSEHKQTTLFRVQFIYNDGETEFDAEYEQAIIDYCIANYILL